MFLLSVELAEVDGMIIDNREIETRAWACASPPEKPTANGRQIGPAVSKVRAWFLISLITALLRGPSWELQP